MRSCMYACCEQFNTHNTYLWYWLLSVNIISLYMHCGDFYHDSSVFLNLAMSICWCMLVACKCLLASSPTNWKYEKMNLKHRLRTYIYTHSILLWFQQLCLGLIFQLWWWCFSLTSSNYSWSYFTRIRRIICVWIFQLLNKQLWL